MGLSPPKNISLHTLRTVVSRRMNWSREMIASSKRIKWCYPPIIFKFPANAAFKGLSSSLNNGWEKFKKLNEKVKELQDKTLIWKLKTLTNYLYRKVGQITRGMLATNETWPFRWPIDVSTPIKCEWASGWKEVVDRMETVCRHLETMATLVGSEWHKSGKYKILRWTCDT